MPSRGGIRVFARRPLRPGGHCAAGGNKRPVSANESISRLRRLALFLTDVALVSVDEKPRSTLQPDDAIWFISAAAEYESGRRFGRSFDSCAGLVPEQPSAAELRLRRNQLLVEIAQQYFPRDSAHRTSREIRRAVQHYMRSAAWRNHSHEDAPPAGLTALDAALHRLLRTRRPLSDRTVRNAIGQNGPFDPAHKSVEACGR